MQSKIKSKSKLHRCLCLLLSMVFIVTSTPIMTSADDPVITIDDSEGNLISDIVTNGNNYNAVYKRSGSSVTLNSNGRDDEFKSFVSISNDNGAPSFTFLDDFDTIFEELSGEVDTLYKYLKEYNQTSSGDLGAAAKFELDDYKPNLETSDDRLTDIVQMYEDYEDFKSNLDSFEHPTIETYSSTRWNRLKILSMAIEFQSRKVQVLAGVVFPLDLLLVSEDRKIEETAPGVKALIETYTTQASSLSSVSTNDSIKELMTTLTEAYNGAAGSSSVDSLYDLDFTDSLYVKALQEKYSDNTGLKTITEALDLIDLWSTSPWVNNAASFQHSLVVDTTTDRLDGASDTVTEDSIEFSAVGGGAFYTYLMSDYLIDDNGTNQASAFFMNRAGNNSSTDSKVSERFGSSNDYVSNTTYPSISTMYSQIQFPRYVDSSISETYRNTFYLGTTPATVYARIFNNSTSELGLPVHESYSYYDDLDTTVITGVESTMSSTSGGYIGYTSAAGVRGMNRFFVTGIDKDNDGIDLMDSYMQMLLSITSTETFINIMKNQYGYEYEVNDDGTIADHEASDELKTALTNWDNNEHYTFVYAINLLEWVEQFYNKFGKSEYTQDMRDNIEETVEFISSELTANGLSPLMAVDTNKDTTENNSLLSSNSELNIVKDFIDSYEWGYELNADYRELFAWTACFVPFETNLYSESTNLAHVSGSAKAKYRRYSRLRQPVSIVVKGSEQTSTDGIYSNLLSNSPQKLEYCTLRNFINSSQTGDTFLYASLQDTSSTTTTVVNTDVSTNADSTTDTSTGTGSDSSSEDSTLVSEETTSTSDTSIESTDDGTGSSSTTSTVTASSVTKSYSTLTSSDRYFGPVYGASNNAEYYNKYSSLIANKTFLENSTYSITEVASLYSSPEDAATLIAEGVASLDTTVNTANIGMARGDLDGTTSDSEDEAVIDYSTSTLMTLQMSPDALYMNFVNTYNMLQDNAWKQEGFTSDLDSFLYIDFLGNIVTESGYVVIPAAANATRYSSLLEYPIYNAMFLNSYPDVKQASNDISLVGNDADKYVLYISSEFTITYNKNYGDYANDSSIVTDPEAYMFSTFDYFYTYAVPEESDLLMYFAKKESNSSDRLQISSFNFSSYIASDTESSTGNGGYGVTTTDEEDIETEEEAGAEEEVVDVEDPDADITDDTAQAIIDINTTIDSLTRNQRWFKSEQNKIKPQDGEIMDDVTFNGMTVNEVLAATSNYKLGTLYFNNKVKSDTTLRTTYGRTLASIDDIGSMSWLTMPIELRKGFYACVNAYIKTDDSTQSVVSARILNEEETEEGETETTTEATDSESSVGIPGKPTYTLPDNRILVSFISSSNLISSSQKSIQTEDIEQTTEDTEEEEDPAAGEPDPGESNPEEPADEEESEPDIISKATISEYYAFNFRKSVVTITGLTYGGVTGSAYLDHIPPYGMSYEWLALKTLHENLYHVWESAPKETSEGSGIYTDCFINFNGSLGAMVAAANGSEDTSVYDSLGNFLSGAGVSISDSQSDLKSDSVISAIGSLFESIYAPYLAGIKENFLTFMPTVDRTTALNYITIIIAPLMMILLVIIAIVLIVLMATLSMKNYNMTAGDIVASFLLTMFTGIFILKLAIPTTKFVFEEPGTNLLQNSIMMQGLYDVENETKDKSHTYFLDNIETFESSPVLYMGKVSEEDCLTYRQQSERAEVSYPMYMPAFDGEKQYINGDIYLQGNGAYIEMSDLFEKSNIDLTRDSDNNLYMIHTMDDSAKTLIYYTPFYNFVESITDTVNAYSKSCTGGYTILNNKQGSTTTGRFDSYINSIFFISPDDIITYSDTTLQAEYDGDYVLDSYSPDFNYTSEQIELADVQLQSGEIVTMNANLVDTYKKMISANSDLNDWLQLKRMLYLVEDTGVFDDTYYDSIYSSRWYPIFDGSISATVKEIDSEKVLEKIYNVNNRVKTFVLNNLMNSSYYISDENLIKLTALKATFEFNKEFGTYFRQGKQDAYPRKLVGYTGNNDYYSKSMYIPLQDIYMGTGKQLSYYVGNNGGALSLGAMTVERTAYILRSVIRMVALVLTVLGLFFMYIFFILRNNRANIYLSRMVFYSFILAHVNLLDIVQYKLAYFVVNKGASISTMTFMNLACGIIFTVITFKLTVLICKYLVSTLGTLKGMIPTGRRNVAYANAGYMFDNTSDMNQPLVDNLEYQQPEEYYNEPEADYDAMNDNVFTQEIPTATDVLPLGADPDSLPDGYNLYETTDIDGNVSYYASKSNSQDLDIANGTIIHKSDYYDYQDEEMPMDDYSQSGSQGQPGSGQPGPAGQSGSGMADYIPEDDDMNIPTGHDTGIPPEDFYI